ncbi:MAG TPA: F0F1 ATP synthase subunit delta [Gammaproteobacteria bacterium]|nr:F0F1 ATP synthase subunit delta [Gammaproteobacteria bacterium]
MELSWTTFLFEIVNFLILVWILKRFLYRPVLNVIAQRRAAVDATLSQAKDTERQAVALQEQYRTRLTDWEDTKGAARKQLQQEIDAERTRLTAAVLTELDQQREKARVLEQRRLNEERLHAEQEALHLALLFATRLLGRLSGPALEESLIDAAVEDLSRLPPDRLAELRTAWQSGGPVVHVETACPVDDNHRQALQEALRGLLGAERVEWQYAQEPALLAGLRVSIGPWVLRANLQDELAFFSTVSTDAGA